MESLEKDILKEVLNEESDTKTLKLRKTIDFRVHKILGKKSKYFHNRATLLATLFAPVFYSTMSVWMLWTMQAMDSGQKEGVVYLLWAMVSIIWVYWCSTLLYATKYGESTSKNYFDTIRKIRKNWEITEEDFEEMMWQWTVWRFEWYCEAQGIYLGMKEYWIDWKFWEMKKRNTKVIIPNF